MLLSQSFHLLSRFVSGGQREARHERDEKNAVLFGRGNTSVPAPLFQRARSSLKTLFSRFSNKIIAYRPSKILYIYLEKTIISFLE